jgi:hypothetical protein
LCQRRFYRVTDFAARIGIDSIALVPGAFDDRLRFGVRHGERSGATLPFLSTTTRRTIQSDVDNRYHCFT